MKDPFTMFYVLSIMGLFYVHETPIYSYVGIVQPNNMKSSSFL